MSENDKHLDEDWNQINTLEDAAIAICHMVIQGKIIAAPGDLEAETLLAALTILVKKQEPKLID